jgi:hypothetical protein
VLMVCLSQIHVGTTTAAQTRSGPAGVADTVY